MLYLLPGRHQPPHRDHLEIVRVALSSIEGTLYLGLIVSPPIEGEADDFEREARLHHLPERTPFTFDQRRRLMEAALEPEEILRVRIVPLPRPEVCWSLIEAIFPEARTWIVPDVGERFDDLKAAFFERRGDRVLRVRAPVRTDGRLVRSLIEKNEPIDEHVPEGVARLIAQWKEKR